MTASPHGVLDFGVIEQLTAALEATLADLPPNITLDLTAVSLLDASALRVILTFNQRAAAAGCAFRVVGAAGLVHRVLEITDTLAELTGGSPDTRHPVSTPQMPRGCI
jgi:anti-anti-sigma factor